MVPESIRRNRNSAAQWLPDLDIDSPPPPFQYSPLQAGEIRLLRIRIKESPAGDSKEYYDLTIVHCHVAHPPKNGYVTISYVWGNQDDLTRIYLGACSHYLGVTRSCASILRRVAKNYCRDTLYVWIDALCINQTDLQERGEQVHLMGVIYNDAREVIIDLGEADKLTTKAFEYIRRRSSVAFGEKNRVAALNGIKSLLKREWFSRTWVLQEVFMSQSASVWCGEDYLPWRHFKEVVQEHMKKSTWSQLSNFPLALLIQERSWSSPEDLLHLLHLARDCGATNPRDKYFALLSLLDDSVRPQDTVPVNYFQTPTRIFTNLAVFLIQTLGLTLLVYKDGPSPLPALSSWVVDWSGRSSNAALSRQMLNRIMRKGGQAVLNIDDFYKCGGLFDFTPHKFITTSPCAEEGLILQVFGLRIGEIEYVSEVFNTMQQRFRETRQYFERWKDITKEKPRFRSVNDGERNEDVLVRLFTRQWLPSSISDGRREAAVLKSESQSFSLLDFSSGPPTEEQIKIDTKLNVHNRRLAFSDTGRAGMVPADARQGDLIYVILDCPMPVVLRPLTGGSYMLVGCGVVDGVMRGEALRDIRRLYPSFEQFPRNGNWIPPKEFQKLELV